MYKKTRNYCSHPLLDEAGSNNGHPSKPAGSTGIIMKPITSKPIVSIPSVSVSAGAGVGNPLNQISTGTSVDLGVSGGLIGGSIEPTPSPGYGYGPVNPIELAEINNNGDISGTGNNFKAYLRYWINLKIKFTILIGGNIGGEINVSSGNGVSIDLQGPHIGVGIGGIISPPTAIPITPATSAPIVHVELKPDNPAYPPRPISTTNPNIQITTPKPGPSIDVSIDLTNPIFVPPVQITERPQVPGYYITEQPIGTTINELTTNEPATVKPTYPPRPPQPIFPNQPAYPAQPSNPNYPVNPVPGTPGTAIGVYPPRPVDPYLNYPNFAIAISRWPYYAIPFPFNFDQLQGTPGSGATGAVGINPFAPGTNPFAPADCQCNNANGEHNHPPSAPAPANTAGISAGAGIAANLPLLGQAGIQSSASIGDNNNINIAANLPSHFNTTGQANTSQNPAFGGIIGFIPIVFFPTVGAAPCQHNGGTAATAAGGAAFGYPGFPAGIPYPAASPCAQCQAQSNQPPLLSASINNQDSNSIVGVIPTGQRRHKARKFKTIQ